MRVLYLALALLVTGLAVNGQTNSPKSDPEAKKVLDAVSTKFKTFKTVQATFAYQVENANGKVLSSKTGTIWMKGMKYKVTFSGQEIYCDGKTIWSYDKGSNEVSISNLDASGGTITPQKLFTNFYDADFLYILNGEKKSGAKVLQEIEMTPTDKSKPFHKVYLQVDKTAKTIYSTKVLENEGNKYTYTVKTMKTNTPVADNVFTWNKASHPGVEEVDLR